MTRQANFFKAAISDWDEVLSGTETALNSTGGAQERMAIYTESLEGKLKTLQATWEEFVLNLQASEVFKTVIDLGTQLISLLDILLNKIPVLSNLIKITLAVGAVGVLISSLQKLLSMLGVFSTAEKAITGIKTAATTANKTFQVLQAGITAFKGAASLGVGASSSLTIALQTMAAASGGASTAILGVVSAIAPFLAIGAAVGLVAFIAYLNSAEKAAKDAEKAIDSFNDAQSEVESAQSELDTINDKIAEINAKDGITLTDKQELQNLKDQREQAEALLETKKQLAAIEAKKAVVGEDGKGGIQKAFTKAYGDTAGSVADLSGVATGRLQTASAGLGGFSAVLGAYQELTELQKEATANGKELTKTQQDALDKATKTIAENQEQLIGWRDSLLTMKEAMSPEEFAPYQGLLDDINTELGTIEQTTAPEVWQGHRLTDLLLGDDASDVAKNTKEQLDTLSQQLADGIINEDVYKQKMMAALTNLANDPEIQEGLRNIFGDDFMDTASTDEIVRTLADTLNVVIPDAANTAGSSIKDAFNDSIETVDHLNDVVGEFAYGLSEMDLSTLDGMNETIDRTTSILGDAQSALADYQSDIDNLQSNYDSLANSMSGMSDAADFIASNMDVLSGSTAISASEWQKLIDTASGITYINAETGEAINLADALSLSIDENGNVAVGAQGGIQGFIGQLSDNANATTIAMENIVKAINGVRSALAGAATTAATWATNVSNTLSKFDIFGVTSGIQDQLNTFAKGATNLASDMQEAIKTSSQTSQKEIKASGDKFNAAANNAKQQYKKVQDAANKAGSSGSGSTKKQTDATKELTEALKTEYEAQKAILDAQKKQLQNQKDLLNQEKSDLADAKNAIQDLIDMTMKMLKQEYQNRIDILEKQIDSLQDDLSNQQDQLEKAYDKQTEALENQLDAFNEKIDAQKEYLKLQKEEQDHAEQLSEKNQAIADVQAQLEELRYDNSAAAQKKRLELLDSLNDAQKDLTDYQTQYDYDTKVDGLDKEQSAFQKQMENEKTALKNRYEQEKQQIEDTYNARIDALEKEKDYIKNTLMDEYNLYQEAISLIQGRSDEFYNRLVE